LYYAFERVKIVYSEYSIELARRICMNLEWITPEEAGNKWGIKTRRVQALCANGQIDGAIRVSRVWLIPKDAPKPPDGRTKETRNSKIDVTRSSNE
jgi:hypothetical protein